MPRPAAWRRHAQAGAGRRCPSGGAGARWRSAGWPNGRGSRWSEARTARADTAAARDASAEPDRADPAPSVGAGGGGDVAWRPIPARPRYRPGCDARAGGGAGKSAVLARGPAPGRGAGAATRNGGGRYALTRDHVMQPGLADRLAALPGLLGAAEQGERRTSFVAQARARGEDGERSLPGCGRSGRISRKQRAADGDPDGGPEGGGAGGDHPARRSCGQRSTWREPGSRRQRPPWRRQAASRRWPRRYRTAWSPSWGKSGPTGTRSPTPRRRRPT